MHVIFFCFAWKTHTHTHTHTHKRYKASSVSTQMAWKGAKTAWLQGLGKATHALRADSKRQQL